MIETSRNDILWRHLMDLPYFRAMVRAVEHSFYVGLDLPGPVLDVGCGDGHFASVVFDHPLDVGLDPWWTELLSAKKMRSYRMLVRSDGSEIPFPTGCFGSVVSNSVLEHIPHVDAVVDEIARVVKPGGRFVFCVPNHRFPQLLLGTQTFKKMNLQGAADRYTNLFQKISRHQHCDSYDVWKARLDHAGFEVERHWDYFPAYALHRMEMGHAFGLPALFFRKLTGRWVLAQNRANLIIPYWISRSVFENPISDEGVYSFYITRRLS